MNALKTIVLFWLIIAGTEGFAQPGSYFPPPSAVNFHDDTLTIFPPDSLPGDPVVLMGYNIYVDGNFYNNAEVTEPDATLNFPVPNNTVPPGYRIFCAKAVYNTWISDDACDTVTLIYGYNPPFLEDWSSGGLEEQRWTISGGNWIIDSGEGNPSPGAVFLGEPGLNDYQVSLESYPLNALGLKNGRFSLDFDLKLVNNQPTGDEGLLVQIWNWTDQAWNTVKQFNNEEGGQGWQHYHLYNVGWAHDKIFKVRFLAYGANSSDIQNWSIDNISIYRECSGILDLYLDEYMDHNKLSWDGLGGGCYDSWLHWDDGQFSGNSIGTGEALEFDVAARWTPDQLINYTPTAIYQISFIPVEPLATYSARIWEGDSAGVLVYDSVLTNPVMHQWNTVTLENPIPIDATKELWVGYHINTPTGYPAATDAGPAVAGYGDMIYYQGVWQTLLELNPELDFNWNISCHIIETPDPYWFYKIYRQTNDGDFLYYASTPVATSYSDWAYLDTNISLPDYYCYSVSAVSIRYGDTCESTGTEICETILLGIDSIEPAKSMKIYPNPAKDLLNIESEEEIGQLRIYNLLGQLVLEEQVNHHSYILDVSSLNNGIYFIHSNAKNQKFTGKIIISR